MIYYVIADISSVRDIETSVLRDKISKHFIKKDSIKRKESVVAKALLCSVLQSQFSITDFSVDCDKNGKPFIIGGKIGFNLSHSGNYALCAVGDENVGCDIQQITPYNPRVVKRFFTSDEFEHLEKSADKDLGFTKMWALKESVLKFSGEGVPGGLDRYNFSQYYNERSFNLNSLYFNIYEFQDCIASVCSENGCMLQLEADILKDFLNERGSL